MQMTAVSRPTPNAALVRSAMGGFSLLGGLVALLGAVMPGWVYYLRVDLVMAGNYFCAFNLGIFAAAMVSRSLLSGFGLRRLLGAACLSSGASLMLLGALFAPTAVVLPLITLGFSTGMLTAGVSWVLSDTLSAERAATMLSLGGFCFGAGAVSLTLLVRALDLPPPNTLLLLASLPLALGVIYWRQSSLAEPAFEAAPLKLSWKATGSPVAVLLALALFFQSASEWAVGGWLAMYWIRRLGVSIETALAGMAVYWAVLTLAKLLSPRLNWGATPFRLLAASTAAALFGCLLLLATQRVSGAVAGVLFLGAGLGVVYPLTLGQIGERFPYFHPGFFNGLFSLALVGGMLAPWVVGHLADAWVIQWAVWTPALGILMVFLLQSALLLEARAGRGFAAPPPRADPALPQRSDPPLPPR